VATVQVGRRTHAEVGRALADVESARNQERRSQEQWPEAYIAPTVWERYDAKITTLRWLLGQEAQSPVTKTSCSGPPSTTDISSEKRAAHKVQYPGHRRGDPPEGIPSYMWVQWVERTIRWALGINEEPEP